LRFILKFIFAMTTVFNLSKQKSTIKDYFSLMD